jgi:hypothetical protein
VRRPALLGALIAASCSTTPEPYRVVAVANLTPISATGRPTSGPLAGPISGPIELLDTGEAVPPEFDGYHAMAAYHVQLPDGAVPWVRIFAAASCDAPGDDPQIIADLGTIRRVGDETHFFKRDVEVAGKLLDVDTQTAVVLLSVTNPDRAVLGKLAVALAPGDETGTGSGSGGGSGSGNDAYPRGGAWLACGGFVVP